MVEREIAGIARLRGDGEFDRLLQPLRVDARFRGRPALPRGVGIIRCGPRLGCCAERDEQQSEYAEGVTAHGMTRKRVTGYRIKGVVSLRVSSARGLA